jgi:hypothetical protein
MSPNLLKGESVAGGGLGNVAERVLALVLDADDIRDGAGEILGRIAVDVLATTGVLAPRSVMGSPRSVITFRTRVKSCSVRNFS